eukprot:1502972-Ditylum_brightwellii.AAC.1
MRSGTMQGWHVKFLLPRLLEDTSFNGVSKFEEALHIMPTWKQGIPIAVEYLMSLSTPIARIFEQYSSQ